MAYAASLAKVTAAIAAIADNAIANGAPVVNTAMPSATHVAECAKWVFVNDAGNNPVHGDFETMVCHASGAEADPLAANKMSISVAVIFAIARLALVRFSHVGAADVSMVEAVNIGALTVHATHQAAVSVAIDAYGVPAARYFGLAYYNAVSFAACNHHHLPAKTKKLASTTKALTGLSALFTADASAEGLVLHDLFHPMTMSWKNEAARSVAAKVALEGVQFANIAKRIPTKAADTGLAMNYATLMSKARDFAHTPLTLPIALNANQALYTHVQTYINAAAANQPAAVQVLRADSIKLAKAAAYVAGFILGKIRVRDESDDLSLTAAGRSVTILGSPVLKRVAEEHPGTFMAGVTSGKTPVTAAAQTAHVAAMIVAMGAAINSIV